MRFSCLMLWALCTAVVVADSFSQFTMILSQPLAKCNRSVTTEYVEAWAVQDNGGGGAPDTTVHIDIVFLTMLVTVSTGPSGSGADNATQIVERAVMDANNTFMCPEDRMSIVSKQLGYYPAQVPLSDLEARNQMPTLIFTMVLVGIAAIVVQCALLCRFRRSDVYEAYISHKRPRTM